METTQMEITRSGLVHFTSGEPKQGKPFILVLQDGALITAEDGAMLQALYSRSPASVVDHLAKLEDVGSGKFMDQFYVGYGHKSIGDCGNTIIFIENVSMLAAKAIQDSELYDGQEVSTRYVDFATQPFINPYGLLEESNPQTWLRSFYVEALPALKEDLRLRFPSKEGENIGGYEKAIAARAFDILRGFLPAGAQTSLAWSTNLRQAADRLANLRVHPLKEVREVAVMIEETLQKAHPHSFGQKRYEVSEEYQMMSMGSHYFNQYLSNEVKLSDQSLNKVLFKEAEKIIWSRPEKTELPRYLAEIGTLQFEFTLDFGSYRDIARHRAVSQRMPLLTTKQGFHEWYLEELPEVLQKKALELVEKIETFWSVSIKSDITLADLQYYLPMGYRVPCRVTGDLPALVYLAELRSGSTVHATLRSVAQDMGKIIQDLGVLVYIDMSENGRFDVRRGSQDIVSKIS